MERLWTPWRMAFIKGDRSNKECIFCAKVKESRDKENYILHRGDHAYVLLNIYPYTSGHLMIASYAHIGQIEDLDTPTLTEIMTLTQRCVVCLKRALNPHGYNIGFNLGAAAGAGIEDHIHLHIVPRWVGDTNFLPVLANTRLIPEQLSDTYDRLLKTWTAE